MGILYIDRQETRLNWNNGALEVRSDGEPLRSVPARLLERVVMRSDTWVTSRTLAALADAGVGILALGGRSGQFHAHMLGAPHSDARIRISQARRCTDPAFTLQWSATVVRAKLLAQARLLRRARLERLDLRKPLTDALGTLTGLITRLRPTEGEVTAIDSLDAIRGIEGAGAAAYYAAYRRLFPESLGFVARRRRPPTDPVNAALSLAYTVLLGDAVQACWARGLDPMIGFLHRPAQGRASMACDLLEPWRAAADALVWNAFRERALRDEHFGRDGAGACLMTKAGRLHFYPALQPLRTRCVRGMRRHAGLAAKALDTSFDVPFSTHTDLHFDPNDPAPENITAPETLAEG